MKRAALALRACATLALAVLTLLGTVGAASAHAQLVASVPGAGERVLSSPTHVDLVFSERLNPLGSGIDVLDSQGRLIASGGQIDQSDTRTMTLVVPQLADGLYTVNWHSLSADDGHSTQGFFNFGVGNVSVPGVGQQGSGDIHAGHGLLQSVLETAGRMLSELGAMLGIGLVIVLALVVAPTSQPVADRIRTWPGWALMATGAGAAIVLPTAASSAGVDPFAYALSGQSGELLIARACVGFVGGAIAVLLGRSGSRWLLSFATISAVVATFLLAGSGHAATFDSLGPIVVDAVHVASAGSWFAGLVVLSAMALSKSLDFKALVRLMTPRFTAVALVSAGLFVLSGAYLWWLVNRTIIDTSTNYSVLLLIKALLVLCALMIGAVNFLGWRQRGRLGPLNRIPIEASLAVVVVALTALIASGSPPGPTKPIQIAREASSTAASLDAKLAIVPARPGPNQLVIYVPAGVTPDQSVVLMLDRLDQASQTILTPAVEAAVGSGATYTTDTVLPAGSQWDASVRLNQNGTELGRARFGFSFNADGTLEGAVRPPIDPLLGLSLLFAALGLVGMTIVLAGGWLPRADPTASRSALLLGSSAAIAAAICALLAGPQL